MVVIKQQLEFIESILHPDSHIELTQIQINYINEEKRRIIYTEKALEKIIIEINSINTTLDFLEAKYKDIYKIYELIRLFNINVNFFIKKVEENKKKIIKTSYENYKIKFKKYKTDYNNVCSKKENYINNIQKGFLLFARINNQEIAKQCNPKYIHITPCKRI